MKKAVSFFCVVLIAAYLGLNTLDPKSPYLAERRFWKARALSQKIVANPDVTPPDLFRKAREDFKKIMELYPENISLTKECLLSIGGLLIHEKKYQEGRDLLAKAMKDYPADHGFGARAQFLAGFSYEKAGDWKTALEEYHTLMDRYSDIKFTLEVPLYIARHDMKEDSEKAIESYKAATAYYRRLADSHPKSPAGFVALAYMMRGYQEQKQWEGCLEVAKEIIVTYPRMLRPYIPMIEAFSAKLESPKRAVTVYQAFIQSHPDHKAVPFLKKRIERLERKEANVS